MRDNFHKYPTATEVCCFIAAVAGFICGLMYMGEKVLELMK